MLVTLVFGVYLRDLPQLVNVGLSVLMFLSAIFYPVSALPERWQPLLSLNPLVPVIEQTRAVLVVVRGHLRSIYAWACRSALRYVSCASGSFKKRVAALPM